AAAVSGSRPPAPGACRTPAKPPPDGPRPRLALLAHVRAAARGAQLAHRASAGQASLALAQVDEELVLEGAADAVGVAEVVDRGALGRDPRLQRGHDRVAQRRAL